MTPVLVTTYPSAYRRSLAVLPFVLLVHGLLLWLLLQNRWQAMVETTVTYMPPLIARILAPTEDDEAQVPPKAVAPAPRKTPLDEDLTLSLPRALSQGSLRVERSVPWFNTDTLPKLQGNNADPYADLQERTGPPPRSATSDDPAAPIHGVEVGKALHLPVPVPEQAAPTAVAPPVEVKAPVSPAPLDVAPAKPVVEVPPNPPVMAPAPAPAVIAAPLPAPVVVTPPPIPALVPITPPVPVVPEPVPTPAPIASPVPVVVAPAPVPAVVAPVPAPVPVTVAPAPAQPVAVEAVPVPSPVASPVAPPGPGSRGNVKNNDAENKSTHSNGGAGLGSNEGSVLGLGVPLPPPPMASPPAEVKPVKPLNLTLPRGGAYRPSNLGRAPSLSDMANAQLRRGPAIDPMAQAVESAETPDCMKPDKDGSGGGLLAAPMMAYKALAGKCK